MLLIYSQVKTEAKWMTRAAASWEKHCARKGGALRRAVVDGDPLLRNGALGIGVGIAALTYNIRWVGPSCL